MRVKKSASDLEDARRDIASKVAVLRRARRMTQAELAQQLGLSQSRLSEIEKGGGSFTAEQFLVILQLFNVTLAHFAPKSPGQNAILQNALARLGAIHLRESPDVLPSELLEEVEAVVREVLIAAESPRHVTALAPVLVSNIAHLSFSTLYRQFLHANRERRLAWLVDNVLEALQQELAVRQPRPWAAAYRRAEVSLSLFLESLTPAGQVRPLAQDTAAPDILDADIRSRKTLAEVQARASDISRRWGIVTSLQPSDFSAALREARAGT